MGWVLLCLLEVAAWRPKWGRARHTATLFSRGTATVSPSNPAPRTTTDDHHWHLARTDVAVALTDLEYALMRSYESFVRWQSECIHAVTGIPLSGTENALLHVVCMRERPKTIRELMQLTNRQDMPNVQYGLRKLIKLGFIAKTGSGPKGVFYSATAKGLEVCNDYAALREKLLLRAVGALPSFESDAGATIETLESLEQVYETVTREAAAFHRRGKLTGTAANVHDNKIK